MMDYETGYQRGLEIALLAIRRIKANPEDAHLVEEMVKYFKSKSQMAQLQYLEEMKYCVNDVSELQQVIEREKNKKQY